MLTILPAQTEKNPILPASIVYYSTTTFAASRNCRGLERWEGEEGSARDNTQV